jgi:hypothetical protein
MSDVIRYIIEALRNKPIPQGIEYINGRPRRMAGPNLSDQLLSMGKNPATLRERIIKDASE